MALSPQIASKKTAAKKDGDKYTGRHGPIPMHQELLGAALMT